MTLRQIERTGSGLKNEIVAPVRLAVLGTGWIAEQVYLSCLLNHPDIQIVAAYDPSLEILQRFAQSAALTPDALSLEACLAPETHAMLLCTPPPVHAQQIAQAVSLNKYVLCEKPVFRNTAELVTLGAESFVAKRLMGSASMRHRSDVGLLLKWVKQGLLGPLERVRLCWRRERGVPGAGTWRTDPEQSPMGVMEDLAPHLLDLLASLISCQVWKELHVTDAVLRCRYGRDDHRSASWFKTDPGANYVVPDQGYAAFVSDTETQVEMEVCWASDLPGDYCSLSFQGQNGSATFNGLLGLSSQRHSSEQCCSLELKGLPPEIQEFPIGPGLQMKAFAGSVDIFAGFCRNLHRPAADFFEIRLVTQWLTEIQEAARFSLPHHAATVIQQIPFAGEIT